MELNARNEDGDVETPESLSLSGMEFASEDRSAQESLYRPSLTADDCR